ncbi:MAG TPA: serine hydrolase domain-containing protein, partial [Chitinophaga sp.]
MKKYAIITFLLTATNIVYGQIPIDSIKATIKQEVTNKRSKSIIVGIVDANGRQVFAEGKKSDSDHTLPDGNTIYEIGSITKVFTSLLLADMSLKRQLNLNDPISKFLPKTVRTPTRNGKEISLLSLSTHRSGMPRFPYNVDPKNLDEPYVDYTVNQLYEYISNFEPPFDIDSKWRYSNVGYGVLGNILTLVASKDLEALITEEICKPLNMNNTVISLTAKQKSNLAIGHAETGTPVGLTDLGAIDAGGALRSNINDLLTFAEANLGLIKTDLYPAMELTHVLQAKKDGDDAYTTMGWTLVNNAGRDLLFKDGGMPGYRSFLGIDKKNKIGVVILSNSNNSVT